MWLAVDLAFHKFQRALGALVHKPQTATSARRARVRVSQKSKQAQKQVFTSKDHWNSPNLSLPHVFFANPSTRSARSAKTNPNARSARSTTNPTPKTLKLASAHFLHTENVPGDPLKVRMWLAVDLAFHKFQRALGALVHKPQTATSARRARAERALEFHRKANKPKSKSSLQRIIGTVQTCLCLMFSLQTLARAQRARPKQTLTRARRAGPQTLNPKNP